MKNLETIKSIKIHKLYDNRYLQTANCVFLHPRKAHISIDKSLSKEDISNKKGWICISRYKGKDKIMIMRLVRENNIEVSTHKCDKHEWDKLVFDETPFSTE